MRVGPGRGARRRRKLAVSAELARRNPAPPDAEFTADQVAYALGESRGRAGDLIDLAQTLETRLPGTAAALDDGTVSRYKAEIIARATALLDDAGARAAEGKVLDRAARLTPGGLRAAIAAAVMEVAPEKAKERREAAARDARVERWAEDSGNAALMGCELPPDEVLPRTSGSPPGRRSCARPGSKATWTCSAPALSWTCCWARTPVRAATRAAARTATGPGPGGFAGRVTLTVPLATVTGLADRPGELGGIGPVDPNPGANTSNRYQNGHQPNPALGRISVPDRCPRTAVASGGHARCHAAGNLLRDDRQMRAARLPSCLI